MDAFVVSAHWTNSWTCDGVSLPFWVSSKFHDQDEALIAVAWQLLRQLKYNLAIRPQRDGRNGPSVLRHIFIVLNIHLCVWRFQLAALLNGDKLKF